MDVIPPVCGPEPPPSVIVMTVGGVGTLCPIHWPGPNKTKATSTVCTAIDTAVML
jgi:hypothetical protein